MKLHENGWRMPDDRRYEHGHFTIIVESLSHYQLRHKGELLGQYRSLDYAFAVVAAIRSKASIIHDNKWMSDWDGQ